LTGLSFLLGLAALSFVERIQPCVFE